jgi:Fe-S cluster assembly protein SufD
VAAVAAVAAGSAAEAKANDNPPLANLNAAFSGEGAWLKLPAGQRPAAPVELVFVGSGAEKLAPQPRIAIELGADARLELLIRFLDCGTPGAWLNLVTDIELAPRAELSLLRIQEHGAAETHTELTRARLGRDASLTAGYVDLGGRLVRNDIEVELAAPGARTELFGVLMAADGGHVDDHIRVDHAAAETRSDEFFRGIIGHRGRGVFTGKIIVRPGAQKIDARQSNDNLLLSDQAEIDTKPEFEIYADDVKCSHGATIGELDPQQIFYLRARGIDERTARGLLTLAFANRILERISLAPVRESAMASVAGQLPDRELREALQ